MHQLDKLYVLWIINCQTKRKREDAFYIIYSNWSNNTCDNHIHRWWQRFCIGELQRQFHHSSILAKNYFKDYLKDNLKNAKSYEEVNYTSSYNYSKGCYEVTLKYRATNSFGALVLEQASGDVYFSDNTVSIKNVKTE